MDILEAFDNNIDSFLRLSAEEAAFHLLGHLNRTAGSGNDRPITKHDLFETFRNRCRAQQVPNDKVDMALRSFAEGWAVLEHDGMIAEWPFSSVSGRYFVTRRGQQVGTDDQIENYIKARSIPRQILHADIESRAWPEFLRGDYDSAVFKAFKAVEIAVRHAGRFAPGDIGDALMRKAFKPNEGVLADHNDEIGEQQSLSNLFSGAVGCFRNPTGHRDVVHEDPTHVFEILAFASFLRRVVDQRASTQTRRGE